MLVISSLVRVRVSATSWKFVSADDAVFCCVLFFFGYLFRVFIAFVGGWFDEILC